MDKHNESDDILFDALSKKKKRRKRKTIIIVAVILAAIAAGLFIGVRAMRRRVNEQFLTGGDEVLSYEATVGSISTTISGSGVLSSVDAEQLTVPAGVEIEEISVRRGNTLKAGDVIATVNTVSVMTALADAQEALDTLSGEIENAENDAVDSYIYAVLHGRVKKVYASVGDSIVDCMTQNGALALISVDGYMAADIDCGGLEAGAAVKVVCSDGTEYSGTVEKSTGRSSTVILSDDGPVFGDEVQVFDEGGKALGFGTLYIHSPIAVTGYAGTVSYVYVSENQYVYATTPLFLLDDTVFSANYDTLLRQHADKEEELKELLGLLHTGALCAPYDGTVNSIDYAEESVVSGAETAVITFAPDKQVSVSVSVDETDILSLELGQAADVTVSSVSDSAFPGEVTEIDKVAESSSGVSYYTAVVTLDKAGDMLTGMTASVDIKIEGPENAVIIPADALHQTSTSAFVYTSYNEETKEYGGMVEVVPGISNNRFVEIRSGLKEGDTVYYTESETNDFFAQFGGMQGGGGPGGNQGGGMPGGMPGGNQGGGRPDGNQGRRNGG